MQQGSQAAFAGVETELAVLRVLAGPQRGAELPLHAGDYLIGSGEACDVVLADSTVAEAHILLSVTDEGVSLEPKEQPAALAEGLLRAGERADLTLPAAIAFGLTSIGIGAPETDWAALALSAPPSPEALADEAADQEAGEAAEEQGPREAAGAEGESAPAPEAPAADGIVEPPPETRLGRWLLWIVPLAVLLGGAAFFVRDAWTAGAGDGAAEPAMATKVAPREAVAAVVESLGLSEIVVERGPTGSPVLTGYLADASERLDLQAALKAAGLQAEDRTRDVENLMDAVALTLGSFSWPQPGFGTHLHSSYAGNGVVVVDGFLGPEVDRGVLSRRLRGDVPGIASLEFRRAGLMEWKAILDRRLDEAGLGQWLKTEPSAGMLRVSGEVTEKEERAWRAVGQGFVNESGGWPKLAIAVTRAGAPAAFPAVSAVEPEPPVDPAHPSVVGVILSQNGPGRALLAGGLSLLEGESLDSGIAVKSVMPDRVVFNNGEREFVVYVKEAR